MIFELKSDSSVDTIKRIRKHNREKDLIHFCDGSELQFNSIEAVKTENPLDVAPLVEMLMEVDQQMKKFKSGHAESNDPFWPAMSELILTNLTLLLVLADEKLTMKSISKLLSNSLSPEQVSRYGLLLSDLEDEELPQSQRNEVWLEFEKLVQSNYMVYCLERAKDRMDSEDRDFLESLQEVQQYWLKDYADLAQETRSSVSWCPFPFGTFQTRDFKAALCWRDVFELNLDRTFKEGR